MLNVHNLFQNIEIPIGEKEIFETLFKNREIRIERIISNGQVTPPDDWYDQPTDEFVVLMKGRASIEFQDNKMAHLKEGDYIIIPAGIRHKVSYTSKNPHCVWLAIHINLKLNINRQ